LAASTRGGHRTVALESAGVQAILDFPGDLLPELVHWGGAVPGLTASEADQLVAATKPLPGPNDVDEPARVALLPEHATGWTGRPGLQGSRAGAAWSTRFVTTSVTLDGTPVEGYASAGPGAVVVEAVDEEAALGLTLRIELLPSGLLRARAAVTNRGDGTYTVDGLTLAFPVPAEASELLDFAGRWGRERTPQRLPFRVGSHVRENRKGRTGSDSAYLLHAGTPGFGFAGGRVYAVHTAFSGNHLHYAERTFSGIRLLAGGELLLPGEVRLDRGETYTSPWVYGSFGTGLDEVASRFHRHLRSRSRQVSSARPVTLNVWEAVTFDHDLGRLVELAERAAKIGVERFVLDDGWFGGRRHDEAGLGDWVVSPDAWPEGLHPLVDRVGTLGMEFGLWFEPEMVNADSDVARAHPEWIMAARSTWPVESRHQQVLNLAIPEAYDHVKGQMSALLDEYDIAYLKWDHNRDLVESGNQLDQGRPAVSAQTRAAYRLLDELRDAYPALEIESCSSGGGRIDLEVLERTDRVWVSDNIDPLERQYMLRWTAQLIPPEYLGSHIASGRSLTTGRVHSLAFRAATAVFGHLGIEWDLAEATDEDLEELRAWVAFFKAERDLFLGGTLVRMDTFDEHLFLHGVVALDQSAAMYAMAVVGSLEAVPGPRIRFRGLDAEATYRIRPMLVGSRPSGLQAPAWWGPESAGYPGSVLSGAALAEVGVAAPIVHPDQAVLFHAERQPPPSASRR
jgi:alpha-galactosidase